MSEDELLTEYSRLALEGSAFVLRCLCIDWDSDGLPVERWEEVQQLPATTLPDAVNAARRQILRRWRHFLHCDLCHRRMPAVFMNAGFCHSCTIVRRTVST